MYVDKIIILNRNLTDPKVVNYFSNCCILGEQILKILYPHLEIPGTIGKVLYWKFCNTYFKNIAGNFNETKFSKMNLTHFLNLKKIFESWKTNQNKLRWGKIFARLPFWLNIHEIPYNLFLQHLYTEW